MAAAKRETHTHVNYTHPLCASVLISNPSVGLVLDTSSPHRFFTIVVLPALSRPLAGEHEGRKRGGPRHTDTRASVRSRAGDDTKPPALTGRWEGGEEARVQMVSNERA